MMRNHIDAVSGSRGATRSLSSDTHTRERLTLGARTALRTFASLGRRSLFPLCCAFGLILAISLPATLSAQTAGQITGHVSDPTGAAIPQSKVTLTNVNTSTQRSTVTTGAGDYTFTEVPPGTYTLNVTHAGFKSTTSESLQLSVQQALTLNFALTIGAVSQSVTVSAAGQLLQVQNATLGTVVENEQITQLPLNGRNYLGLVGLSSNVNTGSPGAGQAGSRQGGDRAGQSISVGGQRIMFDHYTLDGVNNTDPDFNTYIVLPSIDAIQEFKVQTGVYPAQFGYNASQINVLTKSGTNNYHGALFEFIRNNSVDALPYNLTNVPQKVNPFKWNDFGFVLSGPVTIPKVFNGKNRFFFLINDEWLRQRTTGRGQSTLPTQDILNGNFAGFSKTIYDPSTYDPITGLKQPFPGNQIGPIDPISAKAIQLFYHAGGVSTQPTPGNPYRNNYFYSTSGVFNRQGLTLRADYDQSQRSQWSFRWSYGNEPSTNFGFPAAGGTTGSKTVTNYYQYMGSNTWTITPTLVNEARFGYTNFVNDLGTVSAGVNDAVSAVGIPNLSGGPSSTWGIPEFNFGSGSVFSSIGDVNDGPYDTNDPTWDINDNVSWVKGKHTLDFGFQYSRQTFNETGNQFSRGVFNFQNYGTANFVTGTNGKVSPVGGDAFADFLLGDVYQVEYAVSIAAANYVRNVEAAYFDDTYHLTPKLTVGMGLRYELTPPWTDTVGNEFVVNLRNSPLYTGPPAPMSQWPNFVRQGHGSDAYQGINVRWVQQDGKTPIAPAPAYSNGLFPNQLMKTDYRNFAPRFSVSYAATPKLVIRAGYGIFYNHPIANARFDMARNLAGRVTFQTGQNVSGATPQGVPTLFYGNAVQGGGTGVANILPPYAYAMQYDHNTAYSQTYLLDVQQQVGRNWAFEFGYLGSTTRHLYGFLNANQTEPYGYIGNGAFTSIASRTPYPNYGVIQLVHDVGVANYNALSAKANRRFSNGFNLIATYTYAKSMDDTSGIRVQQSQLFPARGQCVSCEYGPSDFDVTNRVSGAVLYDLPIGHGKLWAPTNVIVNGALGGWQVGATTTIQSGTPESIATGSNVSSGNNSNYDRPNATGAPIYEHNKSHLQWLNPAAFAIQDAGTWGNLSRNSVRGGGSINVDADVHKNFHMFYNEAHQLQIRFEAFNAPNHPNWGLPFSNIAVPSIFGQITGAGGMRQLQLSAKYVF